MGLGQMILGKKVFLKLLNNLKPINAHNALSQRIELKNQTLITK